MMAKYGEKVVKNGTSTRSNSYSATSKKCIVLKKLAFFFKDEMNFFQKTSMSWAIV